MTAGTGQSRKGVRMGQGVILVVGETTPWLQLALTGPVLAGRKPHRESLVGCA